MSSGARGASTSSIDAVDVASDNHLDALAGQMFDRVHAYVRANVEATVDEYRLLQNMNDATRQRYDDMRQVTNTVADRLHGVNEKFETMKPYLDQVEEIDNASKRLQTAAYALDAYVKKLEAQYKQLEKRLSAAS